MKSILSLILLCFLTAAWAQVAPLPDDPKFDTAVPLVTQDGGESLQSVVEALAVSIGLTPIVDKIPDDASVYYGIVEPKPFRQIWGIVIAENKLDYILQDNNIIVVGTPESIAELRRDQAPTAVVVASSEPQEDVFVRFYPVTKEPKEFATLISQAVPGVEATALENLSSVSVRGTLAQHDEVRLVLQQFSTTKEPIEQRVYNLSYANAEELAATLQESGVSSKSLDGANAQPNADPNAVVSPQQTTESEFAVVANPSTNSIIVTGTAAVQARIAELVPQLDVPQPQINVQVRIQEISTRAAEDLGINLKAGLGNFATSILDGGLQFVFDAQRALSGLNIGAVLDTLETQNLSRRVDDSSMTVLNNQKGYIQSGGTIYILIPGVDSNIERVIEYGVKIDVTPRITSDGRISMEVNAEVQQPLSDTENPNFLNLSTRRVTSTITVLPGQTILLGGLFQNQFKSELNRVPVLGSIPIIGSLFSNVANTSENIELLLIVNADIVE